MHVPEVHIGQNLTKDARLHPFEAMEPPVVRGAAVAHEVQVAPRAERRPETSRTPGEDLLVADAVEGAGEGDRGQVAPEAETEPDLEEPAREVARLCGLPLEATVVPQVAVGEMDINRVTLALTEGEPDAEPLLLMPRLVRTPWDS